MMKTICLLFLTCSLYAQQGLTLADQIWYIDHGGIDYNGHGPEGCGHPDCDDNGNKGGPPPQPPLYPRIPMTNTPEIPSVAMIATGLIALGMIMRRRRA